MCNKGSLQKRSSARKIEDLVYFKAIFKNKNIEKKNSGLKRGIIQWLYHLQYPVSINLVHFFFQVNKDRCEVSVPVVINFVKHYSWKNLLNFLPQIF